MKNSEYLVSIIVPVYKERDYLSRCIESISIQTYRNIEIILVDDGSVDGSGDICDFYAEKDNRICVYHKENGGLSSARNYGLDRANGNWIGFVDADDWIEPDMIERLMRAAVEAEAEIAICGFVCEYVDGQTITSETVGKQIHTVDELVNGLYVQRTLGCMVWNKLYTKRFFARHIRFPEGCNYEDGAIICEILRVGYPVVAIEDRLYHYRQRESSIIHTMTAKNYIDRWHSAVGQLTVLKELHFEEQTVLVESALDSIIGLWRILFTVSKEEKQLFRADIDQMRSFVKNHSYPTANRRITLSERLTLLIAASKWPLLSIIPFLFATASFWKRKLSSIWSQKEKKNQLHLFA